MSCILIMYFKKKCWSTDFSCNFLPLYHLNYKQRKYRITDLFRSVLKITIFVVWLLWLPALSCKIPENDTAYSEMGLKCQEYTRYSEYCTLLNKAKLKGQCHEISAFRFFSWISWHRWQICHRWCTLPCEYLREFSKKFEMILRLFSRAWGKMIHKKTWSEKPPDTVPLRRNWVELRIFWSRNVSMAHFSQ
jgi:hypothetical protein